MKKNYPPILFLTFLIMGLPWWAGCGSSGISGIEEKDPAYERGRAHLRQGQEKEALEEFLSVTRRIVESPQSHLEVGRLLMKVKDLVDPVAAVYHYRRFLELSPHSKEASTVEQLIITAEREIIRELPGEPYAGHLDTLRLREENNLLKLEVADLRIRLGLPPEPVAAKLEADASAGTVAKPTKAATSSAVQPPKPVSPRNYVVQQGDSLYAISRKLFGDSTKIELIFNANRDVLPSRNSLKIGQTLRIPPRPPVP